MDLRSCVPLAKMCPFPGLNLILGNGPLHPVVMLWGLGCLFVWQPPAPGTVRGVPAWEQWAGAGQKLTRVLEHPPQWCLSTDHSHLKMSPCPLWRRKCCHNSLVTRNIPWELVCLIHQLVINRKKKKEEENIPWSSYITSQEIVLRMCWYTCSEEYVQDVYCSAVSTSQRMKSKIDHQQET